jgi:adenosylcobinamide kinase / adenosylcobinamide-phosphate guanylyltransferase
MPSLAASLPISSSSPLVTLVLGGARSGKSRHAETLMAACPDPVYLATAQALDAEMEERVRRHREARGASWTTVEEPLELPRRLEELVARPVLVECLTLWVSNLMLAERDVDAAADALTRVLPGRAAPTVLVANEVGLGIVPENALARAFRDHAGRLHQQIAAIADRVVLLVAGIPMVIK